MIKNGAFIVCVGFTPVTFGNWLEEIGWYIFCQGN